MPPALNFQLSARTAQYRAERRERLILASTSPRLRHANLRRLLTASWRQLIYTSASISFWDSFRVERRGYSAFHSPHHDEDERGRRTNPGICGEHASDPASIEFFQRQGLDYVSCSPPGWRRPRCASSLEL
ncbi:MAG: hypothetical protein F4Y89_07175 [Gammaproteobacteria bacterium]|nr:hypothetical protein [Gammaproteobacteria bacterium]MYG96223.1 hypothetical protein [Gammaproteobacteria bacterium]